MNIERYIYNVYSRLCSRFYDICREHKDEVDGHTIEEIKTICPDAYQAYKEVNEFLYYTEKYLGYRYDENNFVKLD